MSIIIETNERYHAEKLHTSNTALKKMKISPAHFKAALNNPDNEDTTGRKNGRFIHDVLLEQNLNKFARRLVDETGKQVHGSSKEYKDWVKKLAPDITPIDIDMHDSADAALTAFAESQSAMQLYNGANIEQSIYTKCPHTGLLIKARPDIWGQGYIADLKSCGNVKAEYPQEIYKRDYDLQLAHYGETVEAETGDSILRYFIIAFETEAPFGIKVFEIPQAEITKAKERRLGYLNTIKVCQAENHWPAYADEISLAERPKYLDKTEKSIFEEVS